MTLSRRSFLKVAGLTVVAAAGASMFTGCSLTLPIVFVGEKGVDPEIVNALNKKKFPLVPANAYKNENYMKGYVNALLGTAGFSDKVEYASCLYVEADAENAAHVNVVLKAVASE